MSIALATENLKKYMSWAKPLVLELRRLCSASECLGSFAALAHDSSSFLLRIPEGKSESFKNWTPCIQVQDLD